MKGAYNSLFIGSRGFLVVSFLEKLPGFCKVVRLSQLDLTKLHVAPVQTKENHPVEIMGTP